MTVDQVVSAAGRDITRQFGTGVGYAAFGATAFNRSAGMTYASLSSAFASEKNPDGSRKFTDEEVREKALGPSLLAGSITAATVYGFQFLGKAGMEKYVLNKGLTNTQLSRIHSRLSKDIGNLPKTMEGINMATAQTMLKSAMKKGYTTMWSSPVMIGLRHEGMEEGTDEFINSFVEAHALDENRPLWEHAKDALHGAALGGVMGGTISGVGSAMQNRRRIDANTEAEIRRARLLDVATALDSTSPQTARVLRNYAANQRSTVPQIARLETQLAQLKREKPTEARPAEMIEAERQNIQEKLVQLQERAAQDPTDTLSPQTDAPETTPTEAPATDSQQPNAQEDVPPGTPEGGMEQAPVEESVGPDAPAEVAPEPEVSATRQSVEREFDTIVGGRPPGEPMQPTALGDRLRATQRGLREPSPAVQAAVPTDSLVEGQTGAAPEGAVPDGQPELPGTAQPRKRSLSSMRDATVDRINALERAFQSSDPTPAGENHGPLVEYYAGEYQAYVEKRQTNDANGDYTAPPPDWVFGRVGFQNAKRAHKLLELLARIENVMMTEAQEARARAITPEGTVRESASPEDIVAIAEAEDVSVREVVKPAAEPRRDVTKPEQMTPAEVRSKKLQTFEITTEKGLNPVFVVSSLETDVGGNPQIGFYSNPSGFFEGRVSGDTLTMGEKIYTASPADVAGPAGMERFLERQAKAEGTPVVKVVKSGGGHTQSVQNAFLSKKPVSAEAVDTYGIKIPEGYVKQGDLYVYQPDSQTEKPTTPPAISDTASQRDATKPEQMTPEEYVESRVDKGEYAAEYAEDPQGAEAARAQARADYIRLIEVYLSNGGKISVEVADGIYKTYGEEQANLVLRGALSNRQIGSGRYAPPFARDSTLTYRQYLNKLNQDGFAFKNSKEDYRNMMRTSADSQFPLSVKGWEDTGLKLPEGYVKQGELYVYQPESQTEKPTTPPAISDILTEIPEGYPIDREQAMLVAAASASPGGLANALNASPAAADAVRAMLAAKGVPDVDKIGVADLAVLAQGEIDADPVIRGLRGDSEAAPMGDVVAPANTAPNINDPKYKTAEGGIDLAAYDADEATWYEAQGQTALKVSPEMQAKAEMRRGLEEQIKKAKAARRKEQAKGGAYPPAIKAERLKKYDAKIAELESKLEAQDEIDAAPTPPADPLAQSRQAATEAVEAMPDTGANKFKKADLRRALKNATTLKQFIDIATAAEAGGSIQFQPGTGVEADLNALGLQEGTEAFLQGVAAKGPKHLRGIAKLLLEVGAGNTRVAIADLPNLEVGGSGVAGFFIPSTGIVTINSAKRGPRGPVDTLVHELLHAATDAAIRNPNAAQAPVVKRLDRVRKSVQKKLNTPADQYATSNLDEFLTHFLTDPAFRDRVSRMTPKSERNWVQVIADFIADLIHHGRARTQAEKASDQIRKDMLALIQTPEPGLNKGRMLNQLSPDAQNVFVFNELTESLYQGRSEATAAEIEAFREANPEKWERLSRIREEALREMGYGEKLWHGRRDDLTVMPTSHGFFLSTQEVASDYGKPKPFMVRLGETLDYDEFLYGSEGLQETIAERIGEWTPADIESHGKYAEIYELETGAEALDSSAKYALQRNPDQTDVDTFWFLGREVLANMGGDSVRRKYTFGGGQSSGIDEYVVFSPEQIKSADPISPGPKITPDRWADAGSPDIRFQLSEDAFAAVTPEQDAAYLEAVARGDMETAQRMVDEAGTPGAAEILRNWAARDVDSSVRAITFENPQTGEVENMGDVADDFASIRSDADAIDYVQWLRTVEPKSEMFADALSDIEHSLRIAPASVAGVDNTVTPLSVRFPQSPDIRFQIAPDTLTNQDFQPNTVRETAIGFMPEGVDPDALGIDYDTLAEDVADLDPVNAESYVRSTVNHALAREAGRNALAESAPVRENFESEEAFDAAQQDFEMDVEQLTNVFEKVTRGTLTSRDLARYKANPNALQRLITYLTEAIRSLHTRITATYTPMTAMHINRMVRELAAAKAGYRELSTSRGYDPSIRYQFAGERAVMPQFMRDSLDTAKTMAAAGKSSEEIRAVTGWFPGKYDGKMRWEIPDGGASLRPRWSDAGSLSSLIEHPDLFDAYPDLKFVGVSHRPLPAGVYAQYTPDYDLITIDDSVTNRREVLSYVLHEVQHAIQKREGFARGSSMDEAFLRSGKDSVSRAEVFADYERTAGEIEARDIQARAKLTPEQLKATEPYSSENISMEDAIVLGDSGGSQASVRFQLSDTDATIPDTDTLLSTPSAKSGFRHFYDGDPELLASADKPLSDNRFMRWLQTRYARQHGETSNITTKAKVNRDALMRAAEATLESMGTKARKAFIDEGADPTLIGTALGNTAALLTPNEETRINEEYDAEIAAANEQVEQDFQQAIDDATIANDRALLRSIRAEMEAERSNAHAEADSRRMARVAASEHAEAEQRRADQRKALAELQRTSPDTFEAVIEVRQYINDFQRAASELLTDFPELQAKINGSLNIYLVRSFQIHQDPKLMKSMLDPKGDPNFVMLRDTAIEFFIPKAEAQIMAELERNADFITETTKLADGDYAKMREIMERKAKELAQERAILLYEDWITGHQTGSDFGGGSPVANEISRYMKKKNVPQELRDALMENTDPLFNALNTAQSLTRLVFNQQLLNTVAEQNLELGNFVTKAEKESGVSYVQGRKVMQDVFSREGNEGLKQDIISKVTAAYRPALERAVANGTRTEPMPEDGVASIVESALTEFGKGDVKLAELLPELGRNADRLINDIFVKSDQKSPEINTQLQPQKGKFSNWQPVVDDKTTGMLFRPLHGLYASPEQVEAFKATFQPGKKAWLHGAQKDLESVNRFILGGAGLSLGIMTLGSTSYYVRNLAGGIFYTASNGVNFLDPKVWEAAGRFTQGALGPKGEITLEFQELIAGRVALDGAKIGYMRQLFEDISQDPAGGMKKLMEISGMSDEKASAIMKSKDAGHKGTKKFLKALTALAEFTEVLPAVMVYADFKTKLTEANFGTEAEIRQEASRLTKMVMPSKSEASAAVDAFTRSGFGAMLGAYIRFKVETIRNTANTFRVAKEWMWSDNPTLRKYGMRKMAAFAGVYGGVSTLLPLLVRRMFMGDDEEDAIRAALPKYLQNSTLYFYKPRGGDGVQVINMTYTIPMSVVTDPFSRTADALFSGQVSELPAIWARAITEDLLGENIVFGSIVDARRNRDASTDNPIYLDSDSDTVKTMKAVKHIFDSSYKPRTATQIGRLKEALESDTSNAPYQYTPAGTVLNMFAPVRPITLKYEDIERRAFNDLRRQSSEAWRLTSRINSPIPVSEAEMVRMLNRRDALHTKLNTELYRRAQGAIALRGGGSNARRAVEQSMVGAGVSKRRARLILSGRSESFVFGKEQMEKLPPERRAVVDRFFRSRPTVRPIGE
jgi:hypothetical protein